MKEWYRDDRYIYALGLLLTDERGFTTDHAGRTLFGLTERDHPDLWRGGPPTLEDAGDRFYEGYWLEAGCGQIDHAGVAVELFNTAILQGPGSAVTLLQRAVNTLSPDAEDIAVDGRMGPQTAGAVNGYDAPAEIVAYQNGHQACYIIDLVDSNPDKYRRFAGGWGRRFSHDPFG